MPRADGDWGACNPDEPRNRRTRCSALVQRFGDGKRPTTVLIDTGPDFRQQALAAGLTHIDGVVYTHSHADHLHGIDDLRAFWTSAKRLIDIYSDDATQQRIDEAFGYCFSGTSRGSYPPILRRHRIAAGEPFTISGDGGDIDIMPFNQVHGSIFSLGLRIAGIGYSTDVAAFPDDSLAHLHGLDLWIVDALRDRPHPSHFSVSDAIAWATRLQPKHTVLTHMHADLDYDVARRQCPPGVEPGYDGLWFEFDV